MIRQKNENGSIAVSTSVYTDIAGDVGIDAGADIDAAVVIIVSDHI